LGVPGMDLTAAGFADPALLTVVWPSQYRLDPFDWSAFSAMVALFGLVLNLALLATIYFGYRTVRDSSNAQVSNILIWAASEMSGIKDDIRYIQSYNGTPGAWPKEYHLAASRVSAVHQRLADMVCSKLIKPVHFEKMWGLPFVALWYELEPWVKDLRRKNGEPVELSEGAYSRADFETLALRYEARFGPMIANMDAAKRDLA